MSRRDFVTELEPLLPDDYRISKEMEIPGIEIDVLPNETEEDKEVAVFAFVLEAELEGGDDSLLKSLEHDARSIMGLGGGIVRISSHKDVSNSDFWKTLVRERLKQED